MLFYINLTNTQSILTVKKPIAKTEAAYKIKPLKNAKLLIMITVILVCMF